MPLGMLAGPLPPALLANIRCESPKSWTDRIQRLNPILHQCAAAGMSPYRWLHLVVESPHRGAPPPPRVFFRTMTVGAARGLSEVSIMPLAAISRISSSAAWLGFSVCIFYGEKAANRVWKFINIKSCLCVRDARADGSGWWILVAVDVDIVDDFFSLITFY